MLIGGRLIEEDGKEPSVVAVMVCREGAEAPSMRA